MTLTVPYIKNVEKHYHIQNILQSCPNHFVWPKNTSKTNINGDKQKYFEQNAKTYIQNMTWPTAQKIPYFENKGVQNFI
jgi:hypothetical protein